MMNVDRDSTQNYWQSQNTLQRWKLDRLLMVVALVACAGFLPLGCQTPEEELVGDVGSLDDMAAREQEPREDDSDLLDAADELEPLVSVNGPLDEASEDESELSGGATPETDQSADNFLRQVREEAAAHDRELHAERARLLKELLDADPPEVSTGDRGDDPVEALRTRSSQSPPDALSAEDALDLDAIQKQLSRAAERVEGGDTSQPKTGSAPAEDGAATVAGEVSARPTAAKPLPLSQSNVKPQQAQSPEKKITRAGSYSDIFRLHHKTGKEFMSFVGENFPEWIEDGYIARIAGRTRSLLIFGKSSDDPITRKVHDMAAKFDDLEIRPISEYIRPRYVDTEIAMDALVMRGLAHLWVMTDETKTTSWSEGKKTVSTTVERSVYAPQELAAGVDAPLEKKPKIPYVYEIPSIDSFDMPENMQSLPNDALLVNFDRMSSTERRGGFMAVGTERDIAEIKAFVDTIDQPARLVMIEVQVVQLNADKFLDLGVDSVQFGKRHTVGGVALPLPGEEINQPGFGNEVRRDPDAFVPPLTEEGISAIYDDTSIDLSGRFIANVHALLRTGDATVKARPKILTLDDRVSVLHLGEDVPVFESTGVTRDTVNGNLVNEVNNVTTQYSGFTLNIRPRISGGAEDEVALQVEILVNTLGERTRVFEQDLAGIPSVLTRRYIGMPIVKNHRPVVLGGLILEEEVESTNKVPLLGDIPLLGYLFRRTQQIDSRQEIIMVLTPHILAQTGVDRTSTPKESPIFDTFDSALFNDSHIVKGRDVLGMDPLTGNPAVVDGKQFTEQEVLDLTLLNIVTERELISKLGILDDYLSDALSDLNWIQRKWPERTVKWWSEEDQEVYFRAAAILIENIKELNRDLTYEELVLPRREIILPTTPFRISLSYDQVDQLRVLGADLLRGERYELNAGTLIVLRDAGDRSLRDFADFLEREKREVDDHNDLIIELKRWYGNLYPDSDGLEGLGYPDIYRELGKAKLDFIGLATYFQENMSQRYLASGRPDIGSFEQDVQLFIRASLSLYQRGKKLRALDKRWRKIGNAPEDEEGSLSAGPVEADQR